MLKKKKKGLFSPKTYSWIDIASIKFAVFAFTLFLVSYIPKIADISLRRDNFSDEEINQVETSGYIELTEKTPWGDSKFTITELGLEFRDN